MDRTPAARAADLSRAREREAPRIHARNKSRENTGELFREENSRDTNVNKVERFAELEIIARLDPALL